MSKIIKRVLSMVLCVVVLVSLAAPSFVAEAATYSSVPIVYITGRRTPIYNKSGKKVYPMSTSISDVIDKNMAKIVAASLSSYTTKNWNILGDTLYDLIEPLYRDLRLDKNGEISNGSYIKQNATPATDKDGKYEIMQFNFEYDSRIDPWESAALLRSYISKVLKATGKTKVQIVSRCMGSDILAAYLVRYKSDPKVNTAIFYAPACNGVLINSAPFAGKIEFDADSLEKYLSKSSSNSDEEFEGLLSSLNKVSKSLSSKLGASIATSLFEQAGPKILPRLLLATYATMPGYWAMVSDPYYEEAKTYIFGKNIKQYSGLIKKTDRFHYDVQKKLPSVLKTLKKNGMKINIISKYNIDFDPIYEGCTQQGDGWIETRNSSFGATVANKGKTLSASYLKTLANSGLANYVSGDKIIDASTCLFPDYTFFLKNNEHTKWASCVNQLLLAICNSSSQFTVTSNKNYTQFMLYKSNTITPMSNYKEVLNPTVKTITLSKTEFDYTGKVNKPTVTVKDTRGKALVAGTDYTVTYPSGMKEIGTYTVTVKFKGLYKDIKTKTAKFKIVPATPAVKTKVSGQNLTLSWAKVKGATTYRVYSYDTSTKKYTKVADTNKTSYTIKGLKYGKTYKYCVKSVAKVSGTEYCSKYPLQTINMKPAKPTVATVAGLKSAKLTWKAVAGAKGYQIYRSNSKDGTYRKIATVKDGKTTYTNSPLVSGKTYYYKVRAYRVISDENLYGAFSSVAAVKVK